MLVYEVIICLKRSSYIGFWTYLAEDQVKQCLALGALFGEDDLLRDVLMGTANPADLDTNALIIHVFFRKPTSRLGECGGEHKVGMVSICVLVWRSC
jgi:hypothetical protein